MNTQNLLPKINLGAFSRFYVPATVCHDLTEEQINNGETPEVNLIADKVFVPSSGNRSFDVQNIKTGAIYRNISIDTLIMRKK